MPTVEYLNYEVLDDHGWNMDDEDLFDEAADAGLDEDVLPFGDVERAVVLLVQAGVGGLVEEVLVVHVRTVVVQHFVVEVF